MNEATEFAKKTLKTYENGGKIWFGFESSLKSMGKIRRSHGKFEVSEKYLKISKK